MINQELWRLSTNFGLDSAHKIWTELVTRKAALPIDPEHDVIIEGSGAATVVNLDGATKVFSAGSRSNWLFINFATDAGSVEVGYGPTCAKRWNLPHTPRGSSVQQAVA